MIDWQLMIREPWLFPKMLFYMIFKRHTMITCAQAAERLYEYLDRELPQGDYDKIKVHLELCRICCQKFEFEEILRSIIRDNVKSEKIPPLLKEKILQEIAMQE